MVDIKDLERQIAVEKARAKLISDRTAKRVAESMKRKELTKELKDLRNPNRVRLKRGFKVLVGKTKKQLKRIEIQQRADAQRVKATGKRKGKIIPKIAKGTRKQKESQFFGQVKFGLPTGGF